MGRWGGAEKRINFIEFENLLLFFLSLEREASGKKFFFCDNVNFFAIKTEAN